MKEQTDFKREFICRNHDIHLQCEQSCGWILLSWGILLLIAGCGFSRFGYLLWFGWTLPLIGWGVFRFVKTWNRRCPVCHRRWIPEHIPVVIASGRCPDCRSILWNAPPVIEAGTAPEEPPSAETFGLVWLLCGGTFIVLGSLWMFNDFFFWAICEFAERNLITEPLQTAIVFYCSAAPLLVCLVYYFSRKLTRGYLCPFCQGEWTRRDWNLYRIFGTCSHCGNRIIVTADISELPPMQKSEKCGRQSFSCNLGGIRINVLATARPISIFGIVIMLCIFSEFIMLEALGDVCAGMTPPEGTEPYRRDFGLLGIFVLTPASILLLWEWCKYFFFSRCSCCRRYLDRDIVLLTGRCCHCGEKYIPPQEENTSKETMQ